MNLYHRAADMLERYGRVDGVMHCEVSMLIAELRASAALDELVRENERLGLYDDQKPCWCHQCNPSTGLDRRMILCPICGNKRCPKANDHRNACSGSNEPGQPGSAYAAPAPALRAAGDELKPCMFCQRTREGESISALRTQLATMTAERDVQVASMRGDIDCLRGELKQARDDYWQTMSFADGQRMGINNLKRDMAATLRERDAERAKVAVLRDALGLIHMRSARWSPSHCLARNALEATK